MKKMHRHRSRNDNERNSTELEHFNRGRRSRNGNHSWKEDAGDGMQQHPPKEEYLEKQLEPGDTLQTLSIQFNCPISELKRINNIHRDNEVFARRIIKVPVRYYSLLSEKLVGVHKSSAVTENTLLNENSTISHLHLPKCDTQENNVNLDNNLKTFHSKESQSYSPTFVTLPQEIDEEETINDSSVLLPNNRDIDHIAAKPEDCINDVFQCSGSDWGLSWLQLLTFTILLLLGGPILYLLYHAEKGGTMKALHVSEMGGPNNIPLQASHTSGNFT